MKFEMFKNFLLLVVFAKSTLIYGFNEPRIRNGEITPSDLFEFAVKVRGTRFGCTGSIISKRHVLTAAHCIKEVEEMKIVHKIYEVYQNNTNYAEIPPLYSIDKSKMPKSTTVFLTRNYSFAQLPWNDIAILEFPEGTDFGIEPVKLAKDYIEKEGDEAYITGFGAWWLEGNKSSGTSKELRHKKISMVIFCYGTLRICGGNVADQGLPGDSGGPMLIKRNNQWYQIGVFSQYGKYDYRTRISSYCKFIEEVTKNEAECVSIFPVNQKMPIKHFEPIYNGQSTPLKLFDFVVPFYNYYYGIGCTATVISKRHLLTSGYCVYYGKYAPLSKNSNSRSVYGLFFPDFRSKNVKSRFTNPISAVAYFPLNYTWPWEHNLAIIEFPEGTDFGVKPVTLAKDYMHVYLENSVIIAGYGKYELKQNMHINGTPPMLQHSNASFQLYKYVDNKVVLENTNLMKDEGGPTLIDRNGKFYQIAVNFATRIDEGSRVFVSPDCDFIEEVTKNEVKCESIAPIFVVSSNNNASTFKFQGALFLFVIFTVFLIKFFLN